MRSNQAVKSKLGGARVRRLPRRHSADGRSSRIWPDLAEYNLSRHKKSRRVAKKWPKRRFFRVKLAERQGFEPWVRFRTQHFQCCTLDHSDTSPMKSFACLAVNFHKISPVPKIATPDGKKRKVFTMLADVPSASPTLHRSHFGEQFKVLLEI